MERTPEQLNLSCAELIADYDAESQGYFMHGVGTNQNEIIAGSLRLLHRPAKNVTALVPATERLAFFNFTKLYAVKNNLHRMNRDESA